MPQYDLANMGEDFDVLRRRWLDRYLTIQNRSDTRVRTVLLQGAEDARNRLLTLEGNTTFSAGVRSAQIRLVMKIVREVHESIFKEVLPIIKDGHGLAADAAVDAFGETDVRYLRAAFSSVGGKRTIDSFVSGQRRQAELSVAHAISRITGSEIPLSRRVYRTRSLANGWVQRIVTSSIMRGDSAADIAKAVRSHILPGTPGGTSYAAMRLGRTEINNAFHATTIELSKDRPWVESNRWNLSSTHLPQGCKCEKYAQIVFFPVDNTPGKPHPQCFSGDALVSAEAVRAASKRWYEGRFIDVFLTEDSPQLSGTPNHPALTKRGWVPLSELKHGDYVAVDRFWNDRVVFDGPDNKYVKTRIEDVFKSFNMAQCVSSSLVPQTAEQFHGDGVVGHDVNVIFSHGFLQNSWDGKIIREEPFVFCDAALVALSGIRDFYSMVESLASTGGQISGPGAIFPTVGSKDLSGLRIGPQPSPGFGEHVSNLPLRAADDFRSFTQSQSGRIEFKRIVRVSDRPGGFRGHVYNLETESGAFITDSIVTHNCRCFITPELEPFETFATNLKAGYYRDWSSRHAA